MVDEEIIVNEEEESVEPPVEEEEEVTVPNGVSFDGLHSYTDFGLWLVARPDTGSPKPKLNQIEVPGMDGTIDMTEANAGEVKFTNRTMVFRFAGKVGISEQAEFKANIMNALHGKRIERIILDEDQLWFYTGRVSVQFPKANPWKLYCTITVDAEPYAQKADVTEVMLDPDNYPHEINSIQIGERDMATSAYYISDFRLGTKDFPDGVPVGMGFDRIAIAWNAYTVLWESITKLVQIWDADGGYYLGQFSPNETDYSFDVLYSDIENAGVDLSKIYRITVRNIGNCWPEVQNVLAYVPVQNARKSIIPTFVLSALAPAEILFDDVIYTIPPREPYTNPNFVLHGGLNRLYLPVNGPHSFKMIFQEGKL